MSDLAIRLRLPSGPDRYWTVMREFSRAAGGFSITDVFMETHGVSRDAVRKYVIGCQKQGHVEACGSRPSKGARDHEKLYRVVTRSAKAPRLAMRPNDEGRRGAVRTQLWNALRTLPSFTLLELAVAASTEEVVVSAATATRYIHQLKRAGMIQTLSEKAGVGIYRLKPSANTGPRSPRVFDARVVYDQNTKRIVGEATTNEACP